MRSNLLFYSFDTKSKPGVIIAKGIRFETQEIPGTMNDVKLPLLCAANAPTEMKVEVRNIVDSLVKNF